LINRESHGGKSSYCQLSPFRKRINDVICKGSDLILETKVCIKCGMELNVDMFGKNKRSKDGFKSTCKECRKESDSKYREENRDKVRVSQKKYFSKNRDKVNESQKKWREENKDKINERHRNYYNENKEKEKESQRKKKYRLENLDKEIERNRIYRERNKYKIVIWRKKYKEGNKDKIIASGKKYYKEHLVKYSQWKKKYRAENLDKIKINDKKYKSENKDKAVLIEQRRRARKQGLPSILTAQQWQETLLYFGNKCCYCGKEFGKELTVTQEHWTPLNKKGGYVKGNIIPSCGRCNYSKGDSNFDIWYPKQEYYSNEREKMILEFVNSTKEEQE